MQTGSSKLLQNFLGSAFQSLQFHHDFHTSACLLARPKKINSRTSSSRTPARKRLVPSLKYGSRGGKYEVAPRQFNSEDRSGNFRSKPRQNQQRSEDEDFKRHLQPSSQYGNSKRDRPESYRTALKQVRASSPDDKSPRRDKSSSASEHTVKFRSENKKGSSHDRFDAPRKHSRDEPSRARSSRSGNFGSQHREHSPPDRLDAYRRDELSHNRLSPLDKTLLQSSDHGERPPRDIQSTPLKAPWQKNISSETSPNEKTPPTLKLTRDAAPHEGRAARETRERYEAFAHKHMHRDRMPRRRDNFVGSRNAYVKPSWQERVKQNLVNSTSTYESIDKRPSRSPKNQELLQNEFELSTPVEPLKTLPSRFSSPPLLEGLLQSVQEVLGTTTKATPIQSLSLKHLFPPPIHLSNEESNPKKEPLPVWNEYLLASETGSGKSIAYMLPMIQYLKLTENSPTPLPDSAPPLPKIPMTVSPRGLILAPTHELSRQLSSFAKALLHNVRLRVMCTSQANTLSSSRGKSSTASQFKRELAISEFGITEESQFNTRGRPIDILVSTPAKILEMTKGWGWNKADKIEDDWDDARKERARKWVPGKPEASLAHVEWVVVDEADILFDKDFQETTRLLLADISRARGYEHPSFSSLKTTFMPSSDSQNTTPPITYPFNLVLTSATIPSSLATYLSANHPKLTRLASPKLHQLPTTLKTEHYAYTSGNRNADVEKRIRSVWTDDATTETKTRSKILIFCNKSTKVDDLHLYLKENGVANIALTSDGQARHRGSNRHLVGFLKTRDEEANLPPSNTLTDPHVMITTSLLSRGLDFSPQIKHVFILDEPRNMVDFLHRAGRSGRAGNEGHVVIFGKMKGRGSGGTQDVKKKIYALAH